MANVKVLANNAAALSSFLRLTKEQRNAVYPGLHPSFQLAVDLLKILGDRAPCTYEELAAFSGAAENTVKQVIGVCDSEGLVYKSDYRGGLGSQKMEISLSHGVKI